LADGWGYASITPGSIQADNGEGLTKGIIWPDEQRSAAQARRLGLAPRVGMGRGPRPSISWKPIRPSMQNMSASKEFPDTAKPLW
jgi:hypothetical protein